MDEQAKFRLRIPFGDSIVGKALPIILERAARNHLVDGPQIFLHFFWVAQMVHAPFPVLIGNLILKESIQKVNIQNASRGILRDPA